MIIPIRRARVIILPLANSAVYPFFIAIPETRVPKAFNIKKKGMDITFIIIGPIIGIAAIRAPNPAKISVATPIMKTINKRIFLSIPK